MSRESLNPYDPPPDEVENSQPSDPAGRPFLAKAVGILVGLFSVAIAFTLAVTFVASAIVALVMYLTN